MSMSLEFFIGAAFFYVFGYLLLKALKRFATVHKILLWVFLVLGLLIAVGGITSPKSGIDAVIFGLVIVVTCALGLFKRKPARVKNDAPVSFIPDATHMQKTTNTPQSTDISTAEQKTEGTDADFKEQKPTLQTQPKAQPKKRGMFDFIRYQTMPKSFELIDGEIKATDENGKTLDVAYYSDAVQRKLAIEAYKAHGAEYAAAVIHALPIVKSGKESANVVTGKIFTSLINSVLADNYFSEEEERELTRLCELTGGLNTQFVKNADLAELTRARLVRNLLIGKVAPVFTANNFPIVLQKNEILIWGADNVEFITTKTERQFVAGSRGFNVRIAKGVYYRVGNSRGHTESKEVLDNLGRGFLVVSNKHIFINATKLNKKIPLSKLISVTPYRGEVEICCEGNRGRSIYAKVPDSQFWANVIVNAKNW